MLNGEDSVFGLSLLRLKDKRDSELYAAGADFFLLIHHFYSSHDSRVSSVESQFGKNTFAMNDFELRDYAVKLIDENGAEVAQELIKDYLVHLQSL